MLKFTERLFDPGRLVATPAVLEAVLHEDIMTAFHRHICGDWGDVNGSDEKANDLALKNGDRLFSVYHFENSRKFWIITETDRSYTMVLLPEDY